MWERIAAHRARLPAALLTVYLLALVAGFAPSLPRLVGATLFEVQSRTGAVALVKALLAWAVLALLMGVPVGALACFSLPHREDKRGRVLRVLLPAVALGDALFFTAHLLRAGFAWPNPLLVLLGWGGVLLGALAAQSVRDGARARRRLLWGLALTALATVVGAALVVTLAVEDAPAVAERAPLASALKRELMAAFRGNDPRKIPPGEARTLTLSASQLDGLIGWAASVGLRARTSLTLGDGEVALRGSAPVPGTARWLNVVASTDVEIEDGSVRVGSPTLRVGRVGVPSFVLSALARWTLAWLAGDGDTRPVLAALRSLSLTPTAAALTYVKVDAPPGLMGRLLWGGEGRDGLRAAVAAQIDELLRVLPTAAVGDDRFELALQHVFQVAGERAVSSGDAVSENRAALIALGVVLGHPKLIRSLGDRLDDAHAAAIVRLRHETTLRGRGDWTRHFSVSAALTAISAVAPSDAAGLLKEELDADGGSGFSFADLLADRSGTRLAELALAPDRAVAMQKNMADGVRVDDVFPSAEGLPEGIQDAEFQTKYGGTTGALFGTITKDIEARVARCPALRE